MSASLYTSQNSAWGPTIAELVMEAFERIGMRGVQLTDEHIQSARRSLNFVQSELSNLGINLWKVEEFSVLMAPGQAEYVVPTNIIDVLDVFLRQFTMGAFQNFAPVCSTTAGSNIVTIQVPNNAPPARTPIIVSVPISVGGVVLSGQYLVYSTPAPNQISVQASTAASQTVSSGGVVPSFTTTASSATVTVSFPNHGLMPGQVFQINVPVQVGGVLLQGPYGVQSVFDANTFTITASTVAGYAQTVPMNNGQTSIAFQTSHDLQQPVNPTDIILYPLGRSDYAAIPQKSDPGRPTTFWFDRRFPGKLFVWPVPDESGPYILQFFAFTQMQTAGLANGQIADVPYRWLHALVSLLAAHLAIKFQPERAEKLLAYAQIVVKQARDEDREKVSSFIVPELSGYYR
jgi:hypothetical protein